jgi:hypothetical protein
MCLPRGRNGRVISWSTCTCKHINNFYPYDPPPPKKPTQPHSVERRLMTSEILNCRQLSIMKWNTIRLWDNTHTLVRGFQKVNEKEHTFQHVALKIRFCSASDVRCAKGRKITKNDNFKMQNSCLEKKKRGQYNLSCLPAVTQRDKQAWHATYTFNITFQRRRHSPSKQSQDPTNKKGPRISNTLQKHLSD